MLFLMTRAILLVVVALLLGLASDGPRVSVLGQLIQGPFTDHFQVRILPRTIRPPSHSEIQKDYPCKTKNQ
jgi:hypothetical protein